MLIKSIAVLCIASLGLFSPQDPCSNDIIKTKKAKVIYGKDLGCGGIDVKISDLRITSGRDKGCPAFVLITPSYDTTQKGPGSKTYTRPNGRVKITRLEFTCSTDWFLFIPIGSMCEQVSSTTIAGPTTYAQFPCMDLMGHIGEDD